MDDMELVNLDNKKGVASYFCTNCNAILNFNKLDEKDEQNQLMVMALKKTINKKRRI
jgi:hypothetical protein